MLVFASLACQINTAMIFARSDFVIYACYDASRSRLHCRRVLTCLVESKPNSAMIKTNAIAVILMRFSRYLETIAAATKPRRTPRNGLEMANQKEKFQPECWAIEFVSMVL